MKQLLFIFVFLILPWPTFAATLWVDQGCGNISTYNPLAAPGSRCGSGVNTISRTTIAGGIAAMSASDTLNIRGGTYAESITDAQVTSAKSGSAGNPTIIRAYSTEVVTIRGIGLTPPNGGSAIHDITFAGDRVAKNLKIIPVTGGAVSMGCCGLTTPVYNIVIEGFEANAVGKDTASIVGASDAAYGITYRYGKIHGQNCTTQPVPIHDQSHGAYISAPTVIIEYTEIYDITSSGIHQYSGSPNNNIYRYNWVHDTGVYGAPGCNDDWGKPAILIYTGNNAQVYGNVVSDSQQGIAIVTNSNLVYNNTLYRVGNGNVVCYAPYNRCINGGKDNPSIFITDGSNNQAKNNLLLGNLTDTIGTATAGSGTILQSNMCVGTAPACTVSSGSFTANQVFASTVAGSVNYLQLSSATPAGDGGTNTLYANPDKAGNVVPLGSGVNIGAYEFAGVSPTTVAIALPVGCTGNTTACTTSSNSITLTGTSTNASAISWSCPRCGTSGGTTGLDKWTTTVNAITLKPGRNTIVVQADPNAITASIDVTYAPTFLGNTLAGSWAFNEGAISTATDSSGNNNTGSLQNSPTRLAGKYDNGILLNGTNQYVSVNDASSLHFTQSFTFMAWVKPTNQHTDWRAILVKAPVYLYASSDSSLPCANSGPVLEITVDGGFYANTTTDLCSPAALNVGNWNHVAGTYDNGTLTIYVNGVQTAQTKVSGYMESLTRPLFMGLGYGENSEYLDGEIDEPRIYNFALPLNAPSKAIPNTNCTTQDRADANGTEPKNWSIIGAMNCSIISPTPPSPVKFPASATGLKVGSSAILKFGQ